MCWTLRQNCLYFGFRECITCVLQIGSRIDATDEEALGHEIASACRLSPLDSRAMADVFSNDV